MTGSNAIRSGLIGAVLACACVGLTSGQAQVVSPHSLNLSRPPIVLASERDMIRCTNSCERDLRRCGRSGHCRREYDACIRYCI
jgi:hypothetical protein